MTQAEKVAPVPDVSAMFTVKEWRIRLMRGFLVQVFAQLTGINVINYCQASMYEALGFVGRASCWSRVPPTPWARSPVRAPRRAPR